MHCPVCEAAGVSAVFAKRGVDYFQCRACQTVFCGEIPVSALLTENSAPESRVAPAVQAERLRRITLALERPPRSLLDFGCGEGALTAFAGESGITAIGVDQHTALQLVDLRRQRFDAITLVEVIEHLAQPVAVLRNLAKLLVPGGVIYGESSFVECFADAANARYIDPAIGHRCVFSKQGLATLAVRFRLRLTWINDNVFTLTSRRRPWVRLRRWVRVRVWKNRV